MSLSKPNLLFLCFSFFIGHGAVQASNTSPLFHKVDSLYNKAVYDEAYKLVIGLANQFEANGDSVNWLRARLKIADINRAASNYGYAIVHLSETEKLFQNSTLSLAKLQSLRASIFYEFGKADSAYKYITPLTKPKIRAYHQTNNPDDFILYGAILRTQNLDSSLKYLKVSEQYFEQNKDSNMLCLAWYNLGFTHRKKGNFTKARHFFEKELELAKTLQYPTYLIQAHSQLMTLSSLEKNYKEMLSHYNRIRDLEKKKPALFNLSELIEAVNRNEAFKKQTEKELAQTRAEYQKRLENRKNTIIWSIAILATLLIVLVVIIGRISANRKKLLGKFQMLNTKVGKQAKKLEVAHQTKDRLISLIGHDLLGPMKSLQGVLSLVKDEELSKGEKDAALSQLDEKIKMNVGILNNLLLFAKSLDDESIHKELIDIKKVVRKAIESSENTAREKKIAVQLNLTKEKVKTSAFLVEVVIRNFFSNAIKFSPTGSTIEITDSLKGNLYELMVLDEGSGIPDEKLKKLNTSADFISPGKGTFNETGAGLGLTLVKRIAQNMGATLYFENREGGGAKASLSIPLG